MLILARSDWPLWGKAMDLLGTTAQPVMKKYTKTSIFFSMNLVFPSSSTTCQGGVHLYILPFNKCHCCSGNPQFQTGSMLDSFNPWTNIFGPSSSFMIAALCLFPWSSFKMHDANTSCLSLVHALDLQHIPSRICHEHLPGVVLVVPWNDIYKVPGPYLPCSYHMPQEVARYLNGDECDSKSVQLQWLAGICRNLSKQGLHWLHLTTCANVRQRCFGFTSFGPRSAKRRALILGQPCLLWKRPLYLVMLLK